jgi:chromate transporter
VNFFVLYLLLLKATLTSFSGLSSVPVIHEDLVLHRQVLTETQLNTAVAAGRTGPGPLGLYVVSVGYMVSGIPGAIAGYLATITPAFLVIPLLRLLAAHTADRRLRSAIRAILLAAAGLIVSATIPLGRASVVDSLTGVVAVASALLLALTQVETLWVIAGSAVLGAMVALVTTLL